MSSTNAANGTTTMTVCYTAMAATEKNNPDLLLLVGNTTTNGIFRDGLYTNCNADACPSNRGLALMSWYMRYNLINTLSVLSMLPIRSCLASRLDNCWLASC